VTDSTALASGNFISMLMHVPWPGSLSSSSEASHRLAQRAGDHQSETGPGALDVLGLPGLTKRLKQPGCSACAMPMPVSRITSCKVHQPSLTGLQLDPHRSTIGVLDGIADEIGEDLLVAETIDLHPARLAGGESSCRFFCLASAVNTVPPRPSAP
jgi:hypothetical protein